jgi:CubicO group peptidase (beta-lactamase class C family)/enterochelin esterase-like enzyme/drug/metabolite transporter (DMT)-like permease
MSRTATRLGAVVVALSVLGAGLAGAYSYAQDYSLHRGFTTLVHFRRAGRGRLEVIHFYSHALRRRADYLVYLPPKYSPERPLPVFYLLHGAPGQPRVFVDIANMDVRLDNQLSIGRARPMILVYPDGRIGGSTFSDSEWANTRAGRFESYVIDVMHNVDSRFATIPSRQDRAIGGFSAGAYGAMNIALHHPSDFANVQSWSGYFTQTPTGVFAGAPRSSLVYNSPLAYLTHQRRALRRYPLRVYMFVGRADGSSAQQLPMARALLAAGARVQARFYPGGHDWSVWYPRLNQLLDLASRDFAHPPRPSAESAPRWIAPRPRGPVAAHRRHRRSELGLIGALILALLSAALINLGFVLQHRGHGRARARRRTSLTSGFREPSWLVGQAAGWIGFAGQILAVALAPLTLVQAFSAGSLALSVPLAAGLFGHRVTRRQLAAIVLIAVSLASLPLGFGSAHGHLRPGLLIAAGLLVMLAGGLLARRRRAATLAVLAGAFYGAADGAIKAAAIGVRFHGSGVLTGWTVLAALCTLGGFLTFQMALRGGDAVGPLSLMNAFTALAAIGLGIVAFGEQLGSTPAATGLHIVAIIVVLSCVRPLSTAQRALIAANAEEPAPAVTRAPVRWSGAARPRRIVWRIAATILTGAALVLALVAMLGLLYGLRQLRLLAVGPRVGDALPLLQLAGFDGQAFARLLVAALLAGLVLGAALLGLERERRIAPVGVFALLLLLAGSDASYALARNVRFGGVLLHRIPGFGPWLEAVVLTAACALPGPMPRLRAPRLARRLAQPRAVAPIVALTLGVVCVIVLVTPSGAQLPSHTRPAAPPPRRLPVAQVRRPQTRHAPIRAATGSSLRATLNAALDEEAARIHAPALTAALVRCGQVVWSDAIGRLAVGSPRRATGGTLFVLNSAAKTFVAAMIMKEIEAGRVSLSTRLSRFYPYLPNAGGISVRMLLDMTSGLPDYLNNRKIAWTIVHRPRHRWTVRQVLTGLGTGLGRPRFLPGRGFDYSDTNYIVLGGILEQITRSSIERDLQRLIARPLALTAASFLPTPANLERAAHPYVLRRNGELSSQWIPGYGVSSGVWGPVFTDGGLATSSLDLARFVNALLAGRLVDATAVREMTRIGRGDYGFGLRGHPLDGHMWLGHRGYFGGYEAEDWSDPSRQLTFAAATNVQPVGTGPVLDPVWAAIVRAYERQNPRPAACASPWPVSPARRA